MDSQVYCEVICDQLSITYYFNEFLLMQVLTHDKIEWINGCEVQNAMVFRFCVRSISKKWFLKIIQVTMKHDLFDAI